jgi:copper chaperone CopZ
MTQEFKIEGMTCQGCRSQVEKALAKATGVQKAYVSLEDQAATLVSDTKLDIAILRDILPEKYTIYNTTKAQVIEGATSHSTSTAAIPSKWKQLGPLFLILGYIAVASILLHRKDWDAKEIMLDFIGLFYIVFSFFKFLDLKGFTQSFKMYDPLAGKLTIYAWLYPFLELALGLAFLLRWQLLFAALVTLIILGITTLGVISVLSRKQSIQCACLGTTLKLPMTQATLIENLIMIVMASIFLYTALQ